MKHRIITLTILSAAALALFVIPRLAPAASASGVEPQRRRARQGARQGRQPRRAPTRGQRYNFGEFTHRSPRHAALGCAECHTVPTGNWTGARERGEVFPDVTDYPDHPACIRCHQQQFFSGARPVICTICHTNVSPRDGTRFPFQNPHEEFKAAKIRKKDNHEFSIKFPHDKHQDVMALWQPTFRQQPRALMVRAAFRQGGEAQDVDSCTICHQSYKEPKVEEDPYVVKPPADLKKNSSGTAFWLKVGTFKTSPTSHASCFNCHWRDGGDRPLASECGECHKPYAPGNTIHAQRPCPGDAAKPCPDIDPKKMAAMGITDPLIQEKWLRRESAAFRHDHEKHKEVGCTACHIDITTISKVDINTLDVPILTCGGSKCHINEKPKKILNTEIEARRKKNDQCIKCHDNYGDPEYVKKNFPKYGETGIPTSHASAVVTAPAK